jgi:hypothetical protein
MRTEKDFIEAINTLIADKASDKSLNETQKVFCITSLNILRQDVKNAFKDMRKAKTIFKSFH